MAITLTQLTAFLAVMRGGSVTAAADELIVTQPSVSAAIASLGRELGCELFERDGRGIRPTAAGVAFEPYAADVIGLLDQGRQASLEATAVAARSLRIAAVTTAAESFVPALMRAFADRAPGRRADARRRQPPRRARACARPRGRRRRLRDAAHRRPALRRAADGQRDRLHHGARRPAERDRAAGRVGAGRARLAAARARLGHAPAQRALPRRARPRARRSWSSARTARSSRPPGPGSGSRCSHAWPSRRSSRPGCWASCGSTTCPRTGPWFVLRSAVGPVREVVEAFVAFVRS